MAGDSAWHTGHCITFITYNAIHAAGSVVFCPFFTTFSSLAALEIALWPLYSSLATASWHAARGKAPRHRTDCGDICAILVAGACAVGTDHAGHHAVPSFAVYVADAGGGRNTRRQFTSAIKLQLAGHLLRFGPLRVRLPIMNVFPLNL